MTPDSARLSQKVDRLRKSRERCHDRLEALTKSLKELEHDLILAVAAAEEVEDDLKEKTE